jgi:hypothetical protein
MLGVIASIALLVLTPSAVLAQAIPEEHRGSGRYAEVRCGENEKYRNSGCQPL